MSTEKKGNSYSNFAAELNVYAREIDATDVYSLTKVSDTEAGLEYEDGEIDKWEKIKKKARSLATKYGITLEIINPDEGPDKAH